MSKLLIHAPPPFYGRMTGAPIGLRREHQTLCVQRRRNDAATRCLKLPKQPTSRAQIATSANRLNRGKAILRSCPSRRYGKLLYKYRCRSMPRRGHGLLLRDVVRWSLQTIPMQPVHSISGRPFDERPSPLEHNHSRCQKSGRTQLGAPTMLGSRGTG